MALPVPLIIGGLALLVAATRPKRAQAAPVTSPPKVPPPPVTPSLPGTAPPGGVPGVPGAGGVMLPGGIPWPYGTGSVASCPPGPVQNVPIASLPSPTRESVQVAMATATDANALEAVANQLDFCGYKVAAAEVRMRVNELRAGGGGTVPFPTPPVTPGGPVGGGPEPMVVDGVAPLVGKVASDPNIQWRHVVLAGENPIIITERYFGPTGEAMRAPDGRLRWVELIQYNTQGAAALPGMSTTGDPLNPYSSGFNFDSLVPGQQIRIPKSWNPWISSDGYRRGNPLPWPPASMPGGMV